MAAAIAAEGAHANVQRPVTTAGHRLVLCADDYALAPGVSEGILALAGAGRLSAVSCMTASPFWPEQAGALRTLDGRIDIGLHVTLTDQRPLGPMPKTAPAGRLPSLARMLARGTTGRLDRAEIAAEIDRQIAAFEQAMGRPPDFLDGHQHVHVLPGVRQAVLEAARALAQRWPLWLRSCEERPSTILRRRVAVLKSFLISGLSAGLGATAEGCGVLTNQGFAGVLDYRRGPPLARAMPALLRHLGPRPLIMCHPGRPDDKLAALDGLTHARAAELDYLAGEAFAADLAEAGARLVRWQAIVP